MDGKKKKSRKKKGNQNKVADDASSNAELASEQDHGLSIEQNHYVHVSGNVDTQSVGVSGSDLEMDRHKEEMDTHKEEMERHKVYEEKLVNLQEEVRQLGKEKDVWRQRQANLEEKINVLQNQVDSFIPLEVSLQEKLNGFQITNDILIQKEAILEEKMKHIEDIKDLWILKEISFKDTIAKVQEVNAGLQIQVKELEDSRSGVGEESRQMMGTLSVLELRVQNLEEKALYYDSSIMEMVKLYEEKNPPPYEMETADASVKQDAESGELLKKVNGIYPEPDRLAIAEEHMMTQPNLVTRPMESASPSDFGSVYSQQMFEPDRIFRPSVRDHGIYDEEIGIKGFGDPKVRSGQPPELDDSRRSEEIVQISLDDTPTQETNFQSEDDQVVPLTDAPLIGAPFRLISFVAKYVSGADLAKENASKSGR